MVLRKECWCLESGSSCRPPTMCKTLRRVLGGGVALQNPPPRAHPSLPFSWVSTFCSCYSAVKTRCSKNRNSTVCSSYFERQASLVVDSRRVWGQMGLLPLVIASCLPGPSPRDSPFSELRAHHLHTWGKTGPLSRSYWESK